MRQVAFPAIGAGQPLSQIRDVELIKPGNRPRLCVFGIHAINTALVVAGAKVGALLQFVREIFGMLDHEPIDVRDVKRAVRAGLEHGRTKPIVAGSEKLAVCFVRSAMTGEGDTVGFQNLAMHHVLRGFADENTRREIPAEQRVAIWGRAIGRGQIVGGVRPVEPLLRATDREDAR